MRLLCESLFLFRRINKEREKREREKFYINSFSFLNMSKRAATSGANKKKKQKIYHCAKVKEMDSIEKKKHILRRR